MLFWECRVTHKSGEESLDGIGGFLVSSGIQVIGEILESLFTPIRLLQTLCNLILVFLGTIFQYRPGTVDRAHLPGCAEEGDLRRLLDAGMAIRDDQLNPGKSPFFEVLEESRPELLILTIRDFCAQDLPATIFPHSGDYQDSLGDVPCSVPDFVVGGIHEDVRGCLLNWPQEECLHLIVEVLGHPGNRSRGEVFDA